MADETPTPADGAPEDDPLSPEHVAAAREAVELIEKTIEELGDEASTEDLVSMREDADQYRALIEAAEARDAAAALEAQVAQSTAQERSQRLSAAGLGQLVAAEADDPAIPQSARARVQTLLASRTEHDTDAQVIATVPVQALRRAIVRLAKADADFAALVVAELARV